MGFFDSIGDSIGGIFGNVVGAVGDVVGGIFGADSSEKNAQTNADSALQAAKLNTEYQKEFAQQGIRWRVDDAKEAGLHPLAALGAQTPTYTPSFSMDAFNGSQRSTQSPLAIGLKSLGQNISRAQQAKMLEQDRFLDNAWKAAQIKRLEADTALTQAQASKLTVDSQQLPPAMPPIGVNNQGEVIDGQPDSGLGTINKLIKVIPSETETNVIGYPHVAAATVPDLAFARVKSNGRAPIPSQQISNRIEDDIIARVAWYLRNVVPAWFDDQEVAPPKSWLPPGFKYWKYSFDEGAWFPSNDSSFWVRKVDK